MPLRDEQPKHPKIEDPNTKNWEKVSNNTLFIYLKDTSHIDQASDIALVTEDEIFEIANSQGLQTYIVK